MITAKEIEDAMKNAKLLADLKEPLAGLHKAMNPKHEHKFVIPVEWRYDADENIGGDYAKASIVIVERHVSRLMCECGQEVERNRNGDKK